MESVLNTLSLIGVSIHYQEIIWENSYHFDVNIKYETNYFSAEYYYLERIVTFYSETVPDTVWEDIAEIARSAGDLGSPERYPPPSPEPPPGMIVDKPFRTNWSSSLEWSDGTKTGMGNAKEEILQYLHDLAEKCVDVASQEGPLDEGTSIRIREKWVCPTCGFDDNLTNYCKGCGIMRPEETWKNAAYFARERWTCPECGFSENRNDFCADCGSPKPV